MQILEINKFVWNEKSNLNFLLDSIFFKVC